MKKWFSTAFPTSTFPECILGAGESASTGLPVLQAHPLGEWWEVLIQG